MRRVTDLLRLAKSQVGRITYYGSWCPEVLNSSAGGVQATRSVILSAFWSETAKNGRVEELYAYAQFRSLYLLFAFNGLFVAEDQVK